MNRQFEAWLRSGETNLLSLRLERESYIFLRLPKRPGFDYLFAQRQYRGDGALHAEGIEYAGIYNAADGLVYDADYAPVSYTHLDVYKRQAGRLAASIHLFHRPQLPAAADRAGNSLFPHRRNGRGNVYGQENLS